MCVSTSLRLSEHTDKNKGRCAFRHEYNKPVDTRAVDDAAMILAGALNRGQVISQSPS